MNWNDFCYRQVLKNCLSYDEVKLSAMMTMSSYTEFINDGSRKNKGVVSTNPDSIQPRGIIIGVVGSRFRFVYLMLIIYKKNNPAELPIINHWIASLLCGNIQLSFHYILRRFKRQHVMEYQDILITPAQNTVNNGWVKFHELMLFK